MPDYCTCGAQLPDDALFCHRCGKPQVEIRPLAEIEAEQEQAAVVAPPPPPPPAAPPAIDFRNSAAVRICFLTAILIWTLMAIPVPGMLSFLWRFAVLVGGGFVAVAIYQRRTGLVLNAAGGARLGWITGILCYVIWILFFTVTIVALQEQGGFLQAFREQAVQGGATVANIDEVLHTLQQPLVLPMLLVVTVLALFFLVTLPIILGGALAAKFLGD